MTFQFQGHAAAYRSRHVLFDLYEDALWHCEPCESAGLLATYSTQLLLDAHLAEGHTPQTEEEWEHQHEIVGPIEGQVIPEPTPYYDPDEEAELWETIAAMDKAIEVIATVQAQIDSQPEPVADFPDWYLT